MIDKNSPEWPGIRTWLNEQIEKQRASLESPDCGIKEADHRRGAILMLREIITTVEPPPIIPITEPARPPGTGY